jgi:hypothetical protein
MPKMLSPALVAKLPGGIEFVTEWAYKPEAGYTVALMEDRRTEVKPRLGSSVFAGALDKLS